MNRTANPYIRSTTAKIPAHSIIDLGIRRLRGFGQERGRRHDLAGLAVPALRNVHVLPRLLKRMGAVGRQPFDGGDWPARSSSNRREAGPDGFPSQMYGACPALADSAAILGSGQL